MSYATKVEELWPCHLPLDGFVPKTIIDLGANLGITSMDFTQKFPEAKILGAELDSSNFVEAQKNTRAYENIQLVNVGIADWNGFCNYDGPSHTSYKIINASGKYPCMTLDTFLDTFWKYGMIIDYIKMDIEGSEKNVLQQMIDSKYKFNCVNAEIHDPFSVREGMEIIQNIGHYKFKPKRYEEQGTEWWHLIAYL